MTTSTDRTTRQFYDRLAARVTAVVDRADSGRWDDQSPCEDWTAADVLAHVVDTQRDFLAGRGFELASPPDDDPAGRWRAHAASVSALLDRPDVADASYDGFFGPTTVGDTLARFYGFDMVVHRWDLAKALGAEATIHDDELALLEDCIASFGEHIRADGICGPAVEVAADATRAQQALAATGRDPAWTGRP